ncbi:hypothetical protein [Halorarum halophilum]|nr:hypothetical protein [Halobaculum halophilum]
MNPLLLAQTEAPSLPVTETATVVLVASLLITVAWLLHLYS